MRWIASWALVVGTLGCGTSSSGHGPGGPAMALVDGPGAFEVEGVASAAAPGALRTEFSVSPPLEECLAARPAVTEERLAELTEACERGGEECAWLELARVRAAAPDLRRVAEGFAQACGYAPRLDPCCGGVHTLRLPREPPFEVAGPDARCRGGECAYVPIADVRGGDAAVAAWQARAEAARPDDDGAVILHVVDADDGTEGLATCRVAIVGAAVGPPTSCTVLAAGADDAVRVRVRVLDVIEWGDPDAAGFHGGMAPPPSPDLSFVLDVGGDDAVPAAVAAALEAAPWRLAVDTRAFAGGDWARVEAVAAARPSAEVRDAHERLALDVGLRAVDDGAHLELEVRPTSYLSRDGGRHWRVASEAERATYVTELARTLTRALAPWCAAGFGSESWPEGGGMVTRYTCQGR